MLRRFYNHGQGRLVMWERYKPLLAAWASGWMLSFAFLRLLAWNEDAWRGAVSLAVAAYFLLLAIDSQSTDGGDS